MPPPKPASEADANASSSSSSSQARCCAEGCGDAEPAPRLAELGLCQRCLGAGLEALRAKSNYRGAEGLIHVQIFCLGERGEPRRRRAAERDRSSGCAVGQPGGNPTAIKGKLCISIRNLLAAGKFTLVQLLAQSCK